MAGKRLELSALSWPGTSDTLPSVDLGEEDTPLSAKDAEVPGDGQEGTRASPLGDGATPLSDGSNLLGFGSTPLIVGSDLLGFGSAPLSVVSNLLGTGSAPLLGFGATPLSINEVPLVAGCTTASGRPIACASSD